MTVQNSTEHTVNSKPLKSSKPSKPRCNASLCRKKLKLTDVECRCGYKYCSNHRLPHEHECTSIQQERERQQTRLKEQLQNANFSKVEQL